MSRIEPRPHNDPESHAGILVLLAVAAFAAYYLANPQSGSTYDYTYRIAGALLNGSLGLEQKPPGWLNEMIPLNGKYYSAFPLGSVISILPLAALGRLGVLPEFPGVLVASLLATATAVLTFLLSAHFSNDPGRRALTAAFPIFGTWMWANLAYAGAWQIALGFAVVGQLGALYFTVVRYNPMLAGLSFALAFGNRTELVLLSPILIYLLWTSRARGGVYQEGWKAVMEFIAFPMLLGSLTLSYNYLRFGSAVDFGYSRIPGVLQEPWYRHGIFAVQAIAGNAYAMLLEPWKRIGHFPYVVPTGFGGSLLLSSPYLLYLLRPGGSERNLKALAWLAIAVVTAALWCHGNTGGWQFSYRYAIELIPWFSLIFMQNVDRPSRTEWLLFSLSVAINAWATFLFLRTNYMHP